MASEPLVLFWILQFQSCLVILCGNASAFRAHDFLGPVNKQRLAQVKLTRRTYPRDTRSRHSYGILHLWNHVCRFRGYLKAARLYHMFWIVNSSSKKKQITNRPIYQHYIINPVQFVCGPTVLRQKDKYVLKIVIGGRVVWELTSSISLHVEILSVRFSDYMEVQENKAIMGCKDQDVLVTLVDSNWESLRFLLPFEAALHSQYQICALNNYGILIYQIKLKDQLTVVLWLQGHQKSRVRVDMVKPAHPYHFIAFCILILARIWIGPLTRQHRRVAHL